MLEINLLTPEQKIFSSFAEEVVLPTTSGEIGVLPHHISLLTIIDSGVLKIKSKEKEESFQVKKGFVRVHKNKISILVKDCEKIAS